MIATTIDYQTLQDSCFWLSVVVSFFVLDMVENPRFAVGIAILSVTVPEI